MTNTTLDAIKTYSAYQLSGQDLAGCGTPDELDSPGAGFLTRVRDNVVEAVENGLLTDGDPYDVVHEIADGAPAVYTYEMWTQFLDLSAYLEDPSELLGDGIKDMDQAAGVCLYIIAERLARVLIDALIEDQDEDSDED